MTTPTSTPIAQLDRVSKRYGSVTALDDVDLSLEAGKVTSILGPNGAGKTTAVRILLGLTRPTRGEATLFGHSPTSVTARTRVGAMLQVSSLPATLKVRELVRLFATYYPQPLGLGKVVDLAGLHGIEGRLYGRLSGGQQQRVAFALALVGNPDLLFLDEPTVGLDVETRRAFWQRVRELVSLGQDHGSDDALPGRGRRTVRSNRRAQ